VPVMVILISENGMMTDSFCKFGQAKGLRTLLKNRHDGVKREFPHDELRPTGIFHNEDPVRQILGDQANLLRASMVREIEISPAE